MCCVQERIMKILMLVDWHVSRLEANSDAIQSPDKVVSGQPYWFFRHWPDSEIQVDVLDIGNMAPIQDFEKKVLRFFVMQSLAAYLKRKKYDLIISHSARSGLVLALLRSLLKERLPPHVVIDVGCFNGGRSKPAELSLIKKASRSLSGIIAHSSIQSEYYDKYMPHLPYRFVPFGVDADHFRPLDFPPDDFILSFGSRARDYPTLIKAWGKVGKKRTRLKIIGIDKISSIDSRDSGIDVVGRVSLKTLMQNMAQARFIVIPLPYLKYSYGQMSFLQSMAMGKSCIVTRTPSSEDYLSDGNDALFARLHDPDDLAEKIAVLLHDDSLNSTIARNARQTIQTRYNEKNMANEFHKFISSII
jgi:glycosyltransferase involved in cell wall biosynthesis